jgi:hypothetical protein
MPNWLFSRLLRCDSHYLRFLGFYDGKTRSPFRMFHLYLFQINWYDKIFNPDHVYLHVKQVQVSEPVYRREVRRSHLDKSLSAILGAVSFLMQHPPFP